MLFYSVAISEFLIYNFTKKNVGALKTHIHTHTHTHTQTKQYNLIFARWQIVPQGSLAHTS